ncbi:PKD domain-containing protein, partial [Hymenobacter cavernae]|uniref:PKD domain-containing protein n=1 Tax=Hymenobacter cavernae TaxID=2044852 RepID=UPI0016628FB8
MHAELPHPVYTTRTSTQLIAKPGQPAGAGRWRLPRLTLAAGRLLTLLLLLLSGAATTTALAQGTPPPECSQDERFINTWYFGYKAGLNFSAATDSILPAVVNDSQIDAPAGSGIMADATGNLLFYSNGATVWNRNHTIMAGGTGLFGNPLATDGPLAIKMPGSPDPTTPGAPTRYLLFTQGAQGGPGLSYSEIVIPTGGGDGTVVTKNTPLARGTAEKMTGVFHKNGCDIWIIVHGWGNATSGNDNRGDAFLAYRVTPTGVQPPVISPVGSLHAPNIAAQGYRGQMKVSPNGEQLAVARFSETAGGTASSVELFAFDAETGFVSSPQILDSGAGGYYGVEFSPGRSRLFATVLSPPQLLQFDLTAANVPASKQSIPLNQDPPANLGSMQAGPDGKIYVARENQPALGFISYPDSLGASVGYADDSLQLSGRSGLGLPNFNQSSLLRASLDARSTACLEQTFQAFSPTDNPLQSYFWIFGDGSTSTEENPKHTYPAPGDYVVTLRITTNCFCREVRRLIRVPGAPTPGSIGSDQALCAGTTPAPLTSTALAGDGTGDYSYQWQTSSNNTNWSDIGGATGPSYAPGPLTAPVTYFRRLVTSGFCAPNTPTSSVAITVTPALTAGSIGATQDVCVGATPTPLTSTAAATGGTGTFA